MIRKFLRLQDYIELHDRGEDRMAAQSGLAFYSKHGELHHVDNDGTAVTSLADDAFGWVMNNVLSTTTSGSGSVTFEYDRIEFREAGDGASKRQTRAYNTAVGVDPSESGHIRLDLSNVTIDAESDARFILQLTDSADGNARSGNDYALAEVHGDGTIVAGTSEGGTSNATTDTSQDNTYVGNLKYLKLAWDGSAVTVEAYDGSTAVTVSDNGNYPSGTNLNLAIKVEDQAGSNARNVDADVNRIKRA